MSKGTINMFRVCSQEQDSFLKGLSAKYIKAKSSKEIKEGDSNFQCEFFYDLHGSEKPVTWDWLPSSFNVDLKQYSYPSAVLLIRNKKLSETLYAISFGSAHFCVHKYCDREFGFSFARKFLPNVVKSATYTTPRSTKNRTLNSFSNQSKFLFEGGQSYNKLKYETDLQEFNSSSSNQLSSTIAIGTSINFTFQSSPSLQDIVKLIIFVEKSLKEKADVQKIPIFVKVTDADKKQELDKDLIKALQAGDDCSVKMTEFNIIGTKENFNDHDQEWELHCGRITASLFELSIHAIKKVCKDTNIDIGSDIHKIKLKGSDSLYALPLKSCLDYVNENDKCLLMDGEWFEFNSDFLVYLNESLGEIDLEYEPKQDLKVTEYNKIVKAKAKSENISVKSASSTYYYERVFNEIQAEKYGFELGDRKLKKVGQDRIEVADLIDSTNNILYGVKVGKNSGKLSYVLNQMMTSIEFLHNSKDGLKDVLPGKNRKQIGFGIWLILERSPDFDRNAENYLSSLKYLVFKIQLNEWKKKVMEYGYKPYFKINYKY